MRYLNFHKIIHPALIAVMKKNRIYQLKILSPMPHYKGNVIFAVNHSCRHDMPIVSEIIKRHTYVLVGKQRLDFVDRIFFMLNGVIWVDRKCKADRKKAYQKCLQLLLKNETLCIYPEGSWNLTDSIPILPLYAGIIKLAAEGKVPVIPLILEYKEKTCYIRFGELFRVREDDDIYAKVLELRDIMATLKWEIWNEFPVVKRNYILSANWEQEVKRRIAEYPKLDYEYEKSCIRRER